MAGGAVVAGVAAGHLLPSRKGTRWDQVLQVLVSYRLIAPGSEWKLHRDWFGKSAMADLLGADFGLAESHKLYACHDLLLQHKEALFSHLMARWRDLFNAVSWRIHTKRLADIVSACRRYTPTHQVSEETPLRNGARRILPIG